MFKEPYRTTKNLKTDPIFWVRFVSNSEGWEPPIHHSGMTTEMIKSGRYTPLYLGPALHLDPSDELIFEIKAMASIRLIDGRVELSNVKEIIHAIVHHPLYAK